MSAKNVRLPNKPELGRLVPTTDLFYTVISERVSIGIFFFFYLFVKVITEQQVSVAGSGHTHFHII